MEVSQFDNLIAKHLTCGHQTEMVVVDVKGDFVSFRGHKCVVPHVLAPVMEINALFQVRIQRIKTITLLMGANGLPARLSDLLIGHVELALQCLEALIQVFSLGT